MLDKSFYHGQQGECFRQLEKHWLDIKYEFDTQPNKTFLDPEDFSDSVRGLPEDFDDKSGDYVHGEWQALGIQSGEHEGQSFNDYPILYSILRKFPYKTNVAIMTVGPDTKIGNHRPDVDIPKSITPWQTLRVVTNGAHDIAFASDKYARRMLRDEERVSVGNRISGKAAHPQQLYFGLLIGSTQRRNVCLAKTINL